MATRVRSSSRNSCKSLFSTVSERRSALLRCCLAPVLSFTATLFCCSGGRYFPWRQEVKAVAETHAKASFIQFQKGRSALLWDCLASVLCFTAMLFCCSGGYKFFPWRQELEAVAETHAKASFLQFQKGRSALFRYCLSPVLSFTAMLLCCSGRKFFPMPWHPFCPSLPCCFAVREGIGFSHGDKS